MPIQQMLLGVGAKKKTYMDDVFSTTLYKGNGSDNRVVTNNIDLAGEGGLVWIKNRSNTTAPYLTDTVRGASKGLRSHNNSAETTSTVDALKSFTSTGFTVGTGGNVNENNSDLSSWTFRKVPGFLDIVTYTGNGSNRTIAHSLGSIPGLILIKSRTFATGFWVVYHRDVEPTKALHLNHQGTGNTTSLFFNDTKPTSTNFSVGGGDWVNRNNETYVAYVFAGGESGAATARSVAFNGTSSWIHNNNSSSDFTMGTGDFTVECWAKMTDSSSNSGVCQLSATAQGLSTSNPANDIGIFQNSNVWKCWAGGATQVTTIKPVVGVWTHLALVRHSGKTTLYVNGEQGFTPVTDTNNYDDTYIAIGGYYDDNYLFEGRISNFRVVKGTAVYTSSFRPPTEPLTNITNTKLLCCNNSSVTGSTVTPSTLNGETSTASTDSPFDDPAAFTFGDAGDQGIIKTGSYVGNGSSIEVDLGWEPQWLMIKNTTAQDHWYILDSMMGWLAEGLDDKFLAANLTQAVGGYNFGKLTPTGFTQQGAASANNASGNKFIYIAIRRPDGYCGKPAEVGTDVLSLTYGSNNSNPSYVTNFPVDWAFSRRPGTSEDWYTAARLIQGNYLTLNGQGTETSHSAQMFDYSNGWHTQNANLTDYLSWNWKRHAGFDVVTYVGNEDSGRQIKHNLGKPPEMILVKLRDIDYAWQVGHKGLNGGTNPWNYSLELNGNNSETSDAGAWSNTAPTSSVFSVGTTQTGNRDGAKLIAFLFASVNGISKVGYYNGSGSTGNAQNIGFQPRFLMIKRTNSNGDWMQFNSVRGFGNYLQLNTNQQQYSQTYVNVSSTGFSLVSDYGDTNESGSSYIYYAHA